MRHVFQKEWFTPTHEKHNQEAQVVAMNEKKTRLIEIFQDTQHFYSTNPILMAAVTSSREKTTFYDVGAAPALPTNVNKAGIITVSKSRTFEAAIRLCKQHPDKKVAVLNFASASRPGGGVKTGSSAQEESLCRCSTLYPTLDTSSLWKQYYDVNRSAGNVLHTDACIYSPGIIIFKNDTDYPVRMAQSDWCTIDIISCAAPNLRNEPANQYNPENGKHIRILPSVLQQIHEQRARQILSVAIANHVDILVLGAFGCGAFRNDPAVVSMAYKQVLQDYGQYFDIIEFAVFCRNFETENYDAFANAFLPTSEKQRQNAPTPKLNFDMRGYAAYVKEHNLSNRDVTPAILSMFELTKKNDK